MTPVRSSKSSRQTARKRVSAKPRLLAGGNPQIAKADGDELSRCLDTSTKLEAGGDVGDKELAAAQQACASVKQSSKDSKTIARVNAASSNLTAEAGRRKSGH